MLGERPAARRPRLAPPDRHRPADHRRPGRAHRRELVHHFAGYYPDPRDVDEVIAAVGLHREGAAPAPGSCPAASAAGSTSPSASSAAPSCSSSTSRRPGFDPEARRAFWDLIEALRDDGTTILLTTHYLDEAEHLADRVRRRARRPGRRRSTPRPTSAAVPRDSAVVRWIEDGGRARDGDRHPDRARGRAGRPARRRRGARPAGASGPASRTSTSA